jgi:hypothetical protein
MPYERPVPPPRLYKYQSVSARTLVALKKRTLWFGRPARFNDPFDCAVPYVKAEVSLEDCARLLEAHVGAAGWDELRTDRRYVGEDGQPTELLRSLVQNSGDQPLQEAMSSLYWNRGVTCFSEEPDNMLLWSHYGDSHRGMCLEFDTAAPVLDKLHKVIYSDDIPRFNTAHALIDGDIVMTLALTKAACWSYEREWRAIHIESDKEYTYGVEALTGVYLGAAMGRDETDLIGHILHGSPTHIYDVRRRPDAFRLETVHMKYTPYQYE